MEANFGIATGAYIAERDDWPAAIGRAGRDGWRIVELTAIDETRFDSLLAFLRGSPGALHGFDRVSLHAPVVGLRTSPAAVLERSAAWTGDVVLHPDVYRGSAGVRELGERALFENMDVGKSFGRDVAGLGEVFTDYPEAGFCLDVAHVWTNDRSLAQAYELLDTFHERLRQLHVSGIEPDGRHRPTTADDLALYRPVLDRCSHVPWLLEAELASR